MELQAIGFRDLSKGFNLIPVSDRFPSWHVVPQVEESEPGLPERLLEPRMCLIIWAAWKKEKRLSIGQIDLARACMFGMSAHKES